MQQVMIAPGLLGREGGICTAIYGRNNDTKWELEWEVQVHHHHHHQHQHSLFPKFPAPSCNPAAGRTVDWMSRNCVPIRACQGETPKIYATLTRRSGSSRLLAGIRVQFPITDERELGNSKHDQPSCRCGRAAEGRQSDAACVRSQKPVQ